MKKLGLLSRRQWFPSLMADLADILSQVQRLTVYIICIMLIAPQLPFSMGSLLMGIKLLDKAKGKRKRKKKRQYFLPSM